METYVLVSNVRLYVPRNPEYRKPANAFNHNYVKVGIVSQAAYALYQIRP